MQGRSLADIARPDEAAVVSSGGEVIVRDRLSGLGYIG